MFLRQFFVHFFKRGHYQIFLFHGKYPIVIALLFYIINIFIIHFYQDLLVSNRKPFFLK